MSSKGVVLFAINNTSIDYVKLAEFCAQRVTLFLKVPVCLITDEQSISAIKNKNLFDKIITVTAEGYSNRTFKDGDKIVSKTEWKNSHRDSVFYHSPYDETLVMDVDYIINSQTLNYCWNNTNDFLIYKNFFDLGQRNLTKKFNYISEYSINFYWATVFWFRKTKETESFFTLINHIKNNWNYYRLIYDIDGVLFRNDYAFSIAIHMMNGMGKGNFEKSLPGKLFYILDKDYLYKINNQEMIFLIKKENTTEYYVPLKSNNLDVHVMNKFSLLRNI